LVDLLIFFDAIQVLAASVTRNTSEGLSSSGHDSVYSTDENDAHYGADEDNMISGPKQEQAHSSAPIASQFSRRNKHLRYRTRVFAAEYVCYVYDFCFYQVQNILKIQCNIFFVSHSSLLSDFDETDVLAMYRLQLEQNQLILISCWQGVQ
jgi:hypothetical protein